MRAVIQRVLEAKCVVEGTTTGAISQGLLVFLGIEELDTTEDVKWLAQKIANIRIFNDEQMLMNKDLAQIGGAILLISQFTLFAQTKKGNRPSYIRAAKPEIALPLYQSMIHELEEMTNTKVQCGVFGADMKIHNINDGPVTIFIDTKNKE